jgi:hypothetical protein
VRARGPVIAAAAVALAAILGLGLLLSGTRADRVDAYARERAAQRRAAAATRPAALSEKAPPAATEGGRVMASSSDSPACVTGVETFAVAVERALLPLPPPGPRRVAALRQLSEAAVRYEKHAELARPAPTLPKRMGLANGEPVAPERPACDGRGYAELR